MGPLQFAYHLRANNKQGTFSWDRKKTASDVKLLFLFNLRFKAGTLFISLLGAKTYPDLHQSIKPIFNYFAPIAFSSSVCRCCCVLSVNLPCPDWEARHGRAVAQHSGPLGDRPDQLEVHPEAWARPVWGGLGGIVEQHNTRRHQNTQDRFNQLKKKLPKMDNSLHLLYVTHLHFSYNIEWD